MQEVMGKQAWKVALNQGMIMIITTTAIAMLVHYCHHHSA